MSRVRELDCLRPPSLEERLQALAARWRTEAGENLEEGLLTRGLTLRQAADELSRELEKGKAPPKREGKGGKLPTAGKSTKAVALKAAGISKSVAHRETFDIHERAAGAAAEERREDLSAPTTVDRETASEAEQAEFPLDDASKPEPAAQDGPGGAIATSGDTGGGA